MFDDFVFEIEFFERLQQADAQIAELVRVGRCPRCGGPLHRSYYSRKPRGGAVAARGEDQTRRFSFCCGVDGCRGRATPPSLRFLGRRVYLEGCVIVASVVGAALGRAKARTIRVATGVPARTVARWRAWWWTGFLATHVFAEMSARFVGLTGPLPGGVLERMTVPVTERLEVLSRWLAPITTKTVPEGSRLVRAPV